MKDDEVNIAKRLIIFEPDLFGVGGHYLETSLCVKNCLQNKCDVQIFGRDDLEKKLIADYGIHPFFKHYRYELNWLDRLNHTRYIWRLLKWSQYILKPFREKAFISSLEKLEKLDALKAGDICFFPSLFVYEIIGLIKFMERNPAQTWRSKVILRFLEDDRQMKKMTETIKHSKVAHRIDFFSDTELLIEDYRRCGLEDIRLLPLPHMPAESHCQKADMPDIITLASVGGARIGKGFHLLPGLIRALQNDRTLQPWRMVVQAGDEQEYFIKSKSKIKNVEINKYSNEIKNLGGEVIEQHLSSEEYYKLMDRGDIILFPYCSDPDRIRQTSGVLAEAIAMGKVVVVPDKSWLSMQMEKFGAGVAFKKQDEFNEAVKTAILNYASLRKLALDHVDAWRKFHNIESYINILLK